MLEGLSVQGNGGYYGRWLDACHCKESKQYNIMSGFLLSLFTFYIRNQFNLTCYVNKEKWKTNTVTKCNCCMVRNGKSKIPHVGETATSRTISSPNVNFGYCTS